MERASNRKGDGGMKEKTVYFYALMLACKELAKNIEECPFGSDVKGCDQKDEGICDGIKPNGEIAGCLESYFEIEAKSFERCPHCGARVEDWEFAKYCSRCGYKMRDFRAIDLFR